MRNARTCYHPHLGTYNGQNFDNVIEDVQEA